MAALLLIHVCPSQVSNFWLKLKNKTETDSRRPRSRHSGNPPRDGSGFILRTLGSRLGQEAQGAREPRLEEAVPGCPEHGVGAPTGSSLGQCHPIREAEDRQGCAESIEILRCYGRLRVELTASTLTEGLACVNMKALEGISLDL